MRLRTSHISTPKLRTQIHALNLGFTFGMYHDYQRILKTAKTPPNCPGNSTNFTHKINDYLLFPTTFVPAYESLTHPALPQTSSKNHYLPGTGFKAMRIFKSAFLFKESPSLQDNIQFQSCCDPGLHGARCPIIFQGPLPPNTATSLLPPAAVYTGLLYHNPSFCFLAKR